MIRGAGVQASWSRIATPPAATREPFLPPGPEVMAEVMLLNVARWLKTRPLRNRTVYDVHDRTAPCETLFDAARHLVGKDADENCSTPNRIGVADAPETAPLGSGPCGGDEAAVVAMPARGESIGQDDLAAEDGDRSDPGLDAEINALEWSIGALPLVDRKRLSASTAMSVCTFVPTFAISLPLPFPPPSVPDSGPVSSPSSHALVSSLNCMQHVCAGAGAEGFR